MRAPRLLGTIARRRSNRAIYGDTGLAQEFADEHPDCYAKDAIRQALAERKMFAKRRPESDRRGSAAPVPASTPATA